MNNSQKQKITTSFNLPDGSIGTRSMMDDFRTVKQRIFIRIQEIITDETLANLVLNGINSYNLTKYEDALVYFNESMQKLPKLFDELKPHIKICKRVLSSELSIADIDYRTQRSKWDKTAKLFKMFKKTPVLKIQCKYCGHYTNYIHPDSGFAYLGTNNCLICRRGYPAPDFAWDCTDGQAYTYYRHSVTEPEFYKEFEEQYDVNPDHTHFMAK